MRGLDAIRIMQLADIQEHIRIAIDQAYIRTVNAVNQRLSRLAGLCIHHFDGQLFHFNARADIFLTIGDVYLHRLRKRVDQRIALVPQLKRSITVDIRNTNLLIQLLNLLEHIIRVLNILIILLQDVIINLLQLGCTRIKQCAQILCRFTHQRFKFLFAHMTAQLADIAQQVLQLGNNALFINIVDDALQLIEHIERGIGRTDARHLFAEADIQIRVT